MLCLSLALYVGEKQVNMNFTNKTLLSVLIVQLCDQKAAIAIESLISQGAMTEYILIIILKMYYLAQLHCEKKKQILHKQFAKK